MDQRFITCYFKIAYTEAHQANDHNYYGGKQKKKL